MSVRLLVFGPMHGATTSLSRLVLDADADAFYLFEPDLEATAPAFGTAERLNWPSRFSAANLASLLHCDARAWGGWGQVRRITQRPSGHGSKAKLWGKYCHEESPFSQCSLSMEACTSASNCAKQCRGSRAVGLKSIGFGFTLARQGFPPAWAAESRLALVQIVRDTRQVFTAWRRSAMQSNTRLRDADLMRYCDLFDRLDGHLDTWYATHHRPLYVQVNANAMQRNDGGQAQMALASAVRTLVGLPPLERTRTVRFDPLAGWRAARLRSHQLRRSAPNASMSAATRKLVEKHCRSSLVAEQTWAIRYRGEMVRTTPSETAATDPAAQTSAKWLYVNVPMLVRSEE